ncbi:MAG: ATP-binding protein [Bacteroidota bacterium]
MKIKLLSTLLLFAYGSTFVNAQQATEATLKTAFLNAKGDSASRNRLEELMIFYLRDNTKSKEESFQKLQAIVKKKSDPSVNYFLLISRVVLTHTPDSIIATRKYINEYLQECLKKNDKKNYVIGLTSLSQSESYAGNYDEALKLILRSLDYARDTLKDAEVISNIYLTLGIFYYDQHDTLQAIAYNKKSLAIAMEINNLDNIASVSNNLAMQYSDLAQYDSAKVYFRKSISLFHQFDKAGQISNPLCNLALVFYKTQEFDSALFYARESIHYSLLDNYEESLGAGYYVLAQTFTGLNKQDSAAIYYQYAKDIYEKRNVPAALIAFYPDLAGFYALQGNYKSAYEYLKKSTAIKDMIFNADNNAVIKEMDSKYQASKKAQEILKQEELIKRQQILSYSVMAIAAFFLLLLFFIYRSYRLKQKSNKLLGIAKEKAEQSEKFKQQFLANMSHEIRTPMNAVMGMTTLLIEKNPRPDQFNYLDGIRKSSDNLLHIINDILDLSKIEVGKMELEQIDFSIRDVADQVKQTLHHKAEEKGLELIIDCDSKIPDVSIGDPTRLNQVLMNLTGNAIKFTEKGSVSIEIKMSAIENTILFSIIDTGIGIPKDKLQSVFESFSQANASDTRKFGGTGLGLSISKQLVELMGGTISIESEEGAGTVFSFEINLPAGSIERMKQQKTTEQIDGSILNGLRILIVDDNEYNRIVVHDILKLMASVEIFLATNGKEAIEQAEKNNFDVILMDVQMPLMNGYEATQYIRKNIDTPEKFTPVIALTASVIRTDLDKCRAAGMNDYVPKPFKTSQLITSIANATGREIKFVPNINKQIKYEKENHSSVSNLSYLEKFCNGDQKQMQKYIGMFTSTATDLIEKITAALSRNDFEEIANLVHGYKTKWIMMGMNESKELAILIERQCREKMPEKNIKDDVLKLIEQIVSAKAELT